MSADPDRYYAADFDYVPGSPHLRHARLRQWIDQVIHREYDEVAAPSGHGRVLEIGAGHGFVTERLTARGAQLTVTEMSSASADHLATVFAGTPGVRVVHDPDGDADLTPYAPFDLVLAISVLHHIPDYLAALQSWTGLLAPGGALVTFADPLWYPRRSRRSMAVDRGCYFAWRMAQGELRTGLRSVLRRARGRMDEANIRDMVEYHVLRQGCDEAAIRTLLQSHFDQVEVLPYWSTQAPILQRLGERAGWTSAFGVVARGRTPDPSGVSGPRPR